MDERRDDGLAQRLASAFWDERDPSLHQVAAAARRTRRRRQVGSGLGAAVLLAAVALGSIAVLQHSDPQVALDDDAGTEPETFPRPEPGEVVAITAPDGEPAFLVGSEDGARAFRALRPMSDGMSELVVWCRPTQTFLAPFGITLWTIDGDHVGGPAFGDLLPYRTDVDGDRVTVGRAQPRPERAVGVPDPTDQPVDACGDDRPSRGRDRSPDDAVAVGIPVDADVTVSHAHPEQGRWPGVDRALATTDSRQHLNVRLTLTGEGGRRWRACTQPTGDPPQCPDDAPVVDGLGTVDQEDAWLLWRGYARVETDGTTITDLDYWVTVTDHRGESRRARREARQRERELEEAHQQLGPADRVVVDDGRITIPASEWSLGAAPDEPIPPGTYELELQHHGTVHHKLASDQLPVYLQVTGEPGELTDSTRVELSPGTYTFYCPVTGHREQGEEVELVVGEAER